MFDQSEINKKTLLPIAIFLQIQIRLQKVLRINL